MKILTMLVVAVCIAGCTHLQDGPPADCSVSVMSGEGDIPVSVREGILVWSGRATAGDGLLYQIDIDSELRPQLQGLYLTVGDGQVIERVPLRLFLGPDGEAYTQFIAKRSAKWNVVVRITHPEYKALEYKLFSNAIRP